jgi:hypothetical protein
VRLAAAGGAVAVAAGIIVWAVTGGSSNSKPTSGPVGATPIAPVALSLSGLQTLAKTVPQPIYWAGPKSGYLYELTRTSSGNVYIRYLPHGVHAGAKGSQYLVVATYPYPNAFNALQAVANGRQISVPRGGIGVVDAKDPKSVHIAYPGLSYQIEVYDPSPATARRIAASGAVRPAAG